ncbi:hypothetical protein Z043_122142, partial [Scleropages formosus]
MRMAHAQILMSAASLNEYAPGSTASVSTSKAVSGASAPAGLRTTEAFASSHRRQRQMKQTKCTREPTLNPQACTQWSTRTC